MVHRIGKSEMKNPLVKCGEAKVSSASTPRRWSRCKRTALQICVAAMLTAFAAHADTETVGGYTWTYRINGETADIYNGYHSAAISPVPTGVVTIPSTLGGKPVTSIGESAFEDCWNLTNVTIPDSVTSIGDYAFSGCSGLTSVTIPDSVTSIGMYAFEDCSGLTSVTIGNGVTSIGDCAFWCCSGLTSVTIPDSVTSIGYGAFSSCSGLLSISVDSGNANYKSVNGLLLSKDGKTLILGVNGDVTIPDGVTSIGSSAFEGCSGLTSVTIPNSVTSIGRYAFSDCNDSLFDTTTIPGVELVDGWAVDNTGSLSGNLDMMGVRGIGSSAFRDCSGLTSVTIPDSVTSIGDEAFYDCSGLTSVTIGNGVTSIGTAAFLRCSRLTSVMIPDSVTSIGYAAFAGCSGLTSVTIPDSVTNIEREAFDGCSGLTNVTMVGDCPAVGMYAFDDVASSCIVRLPRGNSSYTVTDGKWQGLTVEYYDRDATELTTYNVTLDANGGNESPTTLAVSANATIGSLPTPTRSGYTFDGWFTNPDGGSLVTEETRITTNVTFYAHWTANGGGSGGGDAADDFKFVIVNGVVIGFEGRCPASLVIPDSVTGIADEVFEECDGLTSVTIPNSVTSIGAYAFYWCKELSTVTIGSGVTSIGDEAFAGCSNLGHFVVAVDNSSYSVMNGLLCDKAGTTVVACPGALTTVTIPSGVTDIGVGAFEGGRLIDLTVPDGVTDVGDYAFSYCRSLKSITLPASVTSIGDDAFEDCSSLTNIIFDGNAPVLGEDAFYGVTSSCTVYVRRGSTGWGVAIPGTWNGMRIEYADDMPDDEPDVEVWTVTFDANGGSLGTASSTMAVTNGMAYGKLPVAERLGYAFDGWANGLAARSTMMTETTIVTNETDHTLYAQWTVNAYTVTFDANGGEGGWSSNLVYGAEMIAPTVTHEGYTFAGWQPALLGTVPASNVTFQAQWTANQYVITFNANGGAGAMSAQTFTNGVAQSLSENVFTRFGYEFVGWAISKDGDVAYRDGEAVTVSSGMTLYAKWEEVVAGSPDVSFAKAQTIDGALYKGDALVGTVQVKVGKISKKGVVKVSATATLLVDGKVKKVTAKAVNVTLDAQKRVPPTKVVFKEPIRDMTFEMEADGSFTLKNGSYLMVEAKIGGAINGGEDGTFSIEDFNFSVPGILLDELLPDGEPFEVSRGKWKFAKAATVKLAKPKKGAEHSDYYDDASGKDLIVDTSKGKSNLSGLKLTYTPKTGQFKGSFKVYALQGTGKKRKLAKYTVNVIGFVVDGVGYGQATCKKPAVSWSVIVQ